MRIVTTTLSALFFALGTTAFAQPGSLDGDFDGDGKVTTDFGTDNDNGRSVAIQTDGKIVVAGLATTGTGSNFALARYNTDGTLDNSFSGDGKVTTAFGTSFDSGRSIAIQPDGKIVVAGITYNSSGADFAVARYNSDGTLDNSFSGDGKVTTNFGTGYDFGYAVALQPDGKIIVAGSSFSIAYDNFAIARYNTDGTLDNSFSGDGKVTTAFGSGSAYGRSVSVQSDGKIVVAGYAGSFPADDFALARYNTDGTLDNSFSGDGKVTTAFGTGADQGQSVAIQADEKIVVAGLTHTDTGSDFAIARYDTDGALDNSFSSGGKVTTAFGPNSDAGRSVVIQLDGKIIVAGESENGSDLDLAVARYLSGLNVGVIEFTLTNSAPLIYPNPIDKRATLEYTLRNAETISIHLLDMQGKTVQTFIDREEQAVGEHVLSIDLPAALPSGTYLIAISSPKGKLTVQVVK